MLLRCVLTVWMEICISLATSVVLSMPDTCRSTSRSRSESGTTVRGPSELRAALLQHPEQFAQTLTEKLTMYALGRGVEYYDMPEIRKIVKDARRDNYRFSSIVTGIISSPEFQSSVVEKPESGKVENPGEKVARR